MFICVYIFELSFENYCKSLSSAQQNKEKNANSFNWLLCNNSKNVVKRRQLEMSFLRITEWHWKSGTSSSSGSTLWESRNEWISKEVCTRRISAWSQIWTITIIWFLYCCYYLLVEFVILNVKREPLKPGCPPSSSVYQFVFFDLIQGWKPGWT